MLSRLLQCFFLNLSSGLGLWRVNLQQPTTYWWLIWFGSLFAAENQISLSELSERIQPFIRFFLGHVQRGRLPGKEPGHPAGRHRRGPENFGEQTPAAAVFQPADQNRFVEIQRHECWMNITRPIATIETETFSRRQTIVNNAGAFFLSALPRELCQCLPLPPWTFR